MSFWSDKSGNKPALFMLAILFVFTVASLHQLTPPSILPADAPADEFSAERAYAQMQAMDVGPHWTGSEGNAQVRDYIAEQLRSTGLEVEIQSVQSFFDNGAVATVENVIGRIRGTDNTKSVLFNVHYDGVASSPGGSYNAYVATFLETVRAVQAGPAPKNDLIFIFNDGEEWGFKGAKGFRAASAEPPSWRPRATRTAGWRIRSSPPCRIPSPIRSPATRTRSCLAATSKPIKPRV